MNKRLVVRVLGAILLIEALAMAPALIISFIYGDGDAAALAMSMGILCVVGLPCWRLACPRETNMRAREGFVVVALSWVLLSLFGALPFVLSGTIPNYVDAVFETVSGFTTTGASIMPQVEGQPHGVIFWRSFTHWIGGMGVLVFMLALLPKMTGRTSHLMRAESPGPSLSKIVPKLGDTAKILYTIYTVLTAALFVALLIAGMNPYDAAIHAVGTAGTGGFSNYALSVGAFDSAAVDIIITIFMALFGVNFALYYAILIGGWRDAIKSEELHWFAGFFVFSMIFIALQLTPQYGNFFTALRYSSFQVGTVMSTTGYATTDFNLWPQASKMLMLILMLGGACAGSTAGGMKIVRVALLCKNGKREIRRTFQPRKVQVVRFEGKGVEDHMLAQVGVFFAVYMILILLGAFVVSLDGLYDIETNLSAAVACVSNIGPGFGAVGPMGNFAGYSPFSKIVLSVLMLCGRLELFPILVLFHPAIWRRG